MGLLDDAIREHLELKRQHGAADDEIERAEQEALGPARRDSSAEVAGAGVPPLEEVPGEPLGEPLAEVADVPPPPPAPDFEDDETRVFSDEAPPVDEPVYADEYAAEPAPADFDEPDPDAAPEPALPPRREPEYDLEPPTEPVVSSDEPADDPEPASPEGDPLEETPEFLQDTPEHDKLWFEQKPPRDFDFD
jgi:hypothetical protein